MEEAAAERRVVLMEKTQDPNDEDRSKAEDSSRAAVYSRSSSSGCSSLCSIIVLSDPFDKNQRQYLIKEWNDATDIFEMVCLKSRNGYGSFLTGCKVISNGNLYVCSRVDPLFWLLPLMDRQIGFQWQPLDQLFEDLPKIIRNAIAENQIHHLCQFNNSITQDETFYKFCTEKTTQWLLQKHQRIASTISKQMHKTNQHTPKLPSVNGYIIPEDAQSQPSENNIEQQHQQTAETALLLLSEYLNEHWTAILAKKLNIKFHVDAPQDNPHPSNNWAPDEETDKLMHYTTGINTQNSTSSDNSIKSNKVSAQTVGLKRLAKVNTKGMKSLSSFFGAVKKKPKTS